MLLPQLRYQLVNWQDHAAAWQIIPPLVEVLVPHAKVEMQMMGKCATTTLATSLLGPLVSVQERPPAIATLVLFKVELEGLIQPVQR